MCVRVIMLVVQAGAAGAGGGGGGPLHNVVVGDNSPEDVDMEPPSWIDQVCRNVYIALSLFSLVARA